ncbi:MAG: LTA synthase family protein [Bacteroidales bacterium]|nr:LTA synthase family protein [Bacteroidales bacterium]
MKNLFRDLKSQPVIIMTINMLLAMILYMAERLFFFFEYKSAFSDVDLSEMMTICFGGLRFDISSLCYINLICILLQTIPSKIRDTIKYQKIVKFIFLIVNIPFILANVADVVYYEFGGRRTTSTFFSEFGNETNIGTILLNTLTQNWEVWLFGIASVLILIIFYYNPIKKQDNKYHYLAGKSYYISNSIIMCLAIFLAIGGARGGFGLKMHPMRMDVADIYCNKPSHTAIVLNTPFTLITTIHKSGYKNPNFFKSEELDSYFNPIIIPDSTNQIKKYNIVLIIMESFSREYTSIFNKNIPDYQGYTPFLDSLIKESFAFEYSFANGIRSVDCMPGVLAGIPRYKEPYCYYFYANNTLQGLPEMLKNEGYYCAFFHGAPNTSLGFKGFANAVGYQDYYGMTEYNNDADFDGTWAIWDEPFFDYFAENTDKISKEGKPFFVTIFSASSHQPYKVPEKYEGKFKEGKIPMHKAISYADYSLKQYFEKVKNYDWYNNTIFVFTADHTGPGALDEYQGECGRFLIPIFFYTPNGMLPKKIDNQRIIQQMDITPTLLNLINYNKSYFTFGKNILESDSTGYINYVFNDLNGTSQYYLDTLMIQYKADKLFGIFDYQKDITLQNNLISQKEEFPQLEFMENQMKAIIQQYVERMKDNKLTANQK